MADLITPTQDPYQMFHQWMEEAEKTEVNDPNAMALATADSGGQPSVRMVLLKGVDARGFVFYTNSGSQKGQELAVNAKAALCFHWKSQCRQIRIQGDVVKVDAMEADAYFASRNRGSRIGAWASQQSQPLDSRETLQKRVADYDARYGDEEAVPRPPYWNGYRVIPKRIEFWSDGEFRLHDRFVYRSKTDGQWDVRRLYP